MIACALSATATPSATTNTFSGDTTGVLLAVQAQPNTYTAASQQINYNFVVTNNTSSAIAGPVTVTDDKLTVTCPALNTIGDKDDSLDPAPNESITCISTYTTTPLDLANGSFTDVARARVGATDSNTVTTVIRIAENKVLNITVTANPTTYTGANQQITYTYVVKNTGAPTLGPTQFIVRDDRIPNPINCGAADARLATNESVTCNAVYTTTPADTNVAQIVNTASASGGGATSVANASATVTNTSFAGGGPGTYTKGSTIKHQVEKGEWMLQIARCYGISFDALQSANPQVSDPDIIFPFPKTSELTVPNIGSVGTIYGKPCVKFYIVKSGDTWDSIANDPAHNAAVNILMEANKGVTLSNGKEIKIPLNSKNYGTTPNTPVTPIPSNQPVRLNFPAGSPKVTLSGNISTPQTIRHVFTGATGQILTVKLTTPANDVNLAIYAPNGSAIQALGLTNSWSGTLTANGDHFIDIVSSIGGTKQYTLEVTLNTPGPTSSIERVVDINVGSGDSNVSHLRSFNGQLYFQANANDGIGAELWRYDTGLKALNRVSDISAGAGSSEPAFLVQFGDMLYFSANGNDGGGRELWRYNGSATGRVTDINSQAADANPMYLTVFRNALYFRATGTDGKGAELWKYDGNVTSRITDLNPDAGDSNPAYLAVFNDALYFSAVSNDGAGTELWKYDGTNTVRVADINVGIGNSNPAFLTSFNGALYFSANGNDNSGAELWKFDGTNAIRAADINPGPPDSVPTYLTVFNNILYFSASGDASGFELWKFDGTAATRVADINPNGNSNPAYLTVHNNELYFQANASDGAGAELWKFKGP
jgi:ELWxxDGT repeat protein